MTEEIKAKRKRITPAEWATANALWESGQHTLGEISKQLDISKEHLSRQFKKNNVEKGAKVADITGRVEEEIINAAAAATKLRVTRIGETKEQHYVWADAVIKMMMMSVGKANKAGSPMAIVDADAKAGERVLSVLSKAQQIKWQCLGLDKEDFVGTDELPELPIKNLTEVEIEEIRNRATAISMGVNDGLGGMLAEEEENLIIEEGFNESDSAVE
jgi:hypothetical protein